MNIVATPTLQFADGRLSLWATTAFSAFRSDDASQSWTNAIGMRIRRGALSASLSLGQDIGYRSERHMIAIPGSDTLPGALQDSIAKGIGRPQNGGGFAPIAQDSTSEVTSRAALVGASVAALQWTGARLSARVYYGVAFSTGSSRRPWAGGDVNLALGATSLMVALEQRVRPAIGDPHNGTLAAHVGFRFDAIPWSRGHDKHTAAVAMPAPSAVAESRFVAEQVGRAIRFRIHAPGAQRVEIAGNLTAWEERDMRADVSGWWEIELPGEKGLHRLRVRIDGGPWMAPPTAASARDEFGEVVGMVVVQ